jgi:hypothetical protein
VQRGRGRDGQPWEEVAERLRSQGPEALDALKPPAPEIIRLFYGLVDGTPWTQAAIGDHLRLGKARVGAILRSAAVARLLGEPGHYANRQTFTVACAICASPVERTAHELRDRVQTTCGPDCRREFFRRSARQLTRDAAARARRLERLREVTSSTEFSEQVRQRTLTRSRPYAQALQALPIAAFAVLPVLERDLLRQY